MSVQAIKKGTLYGCRAAYFRLLEPGSKSAVFNYTRSTLPDLRALADTQTRFGLPSTRIRTF